MAILHLTKAYHSFIIRVKIMLMEVSQKKVASENAHQDEKSWGAEKERQSLTRSSAVFCTFERVGGQGEKEKAGIVKENTKLRKKKWGTKDS